MPNGGRQPALHFYVVLLRTLNRIAIGLSVADISHEPGCDSRTVHLSEVKDGAQVHITVKIDALLTIESGEPPNENPPTSTRGSAPQA
jgi:hypothetical protein